MASLATIPGFGAPGDPASFYGTGSTDQKTEPASTQQLSLSSGVVAPAAPLSQVSIPSTALTAPTGGAAPDADNTFTPQKPNLLAYSTGAGNMQRLYKQIYGTEDPTANSKPPGQDAIARAPQTPPPDDTDTTGNKAAEDYVKHGQEFVDSTNRAVGNATTFGLDYDTKGYDQEDNGHGAFGYNTRDPNLAGASLPISVIQNSIGDYTKDPKIFNAIKNGEYKVAVTNQDGHTEVVPLVDAGPAEWTGNAVDLTYKTSHDLGTQGKAKVGYQIIGPDGHPVPVKGYHPHAVSRVNYDDHIGSNRKQIPAGPMEPVKPTPIPAGPTEPAKRTQVTKTSTTIIPKGDTTVDNTVDSKGATTTVNGKQVAADEVEDMGEKPKEGRSEEETPIHKENAAAQKQKDKDDAAAEAKKKESTAETDRSYGRYGKDLTQEEGEKMIDEALKENQ